ncbi:ABC transporter substrate-binding protein [Haloferula sp.]|uniref:ABC transporter substrate-binding protein n=1 Tax=Haloferula sp. TaxID=2497595 RepID=UPI00329C9B38
MRNVLHLLVPLLAMLWFSSCREAREWPDYDSNEERLNFEERYNRETLEKLNKRVAEVEEALGEDPDEAKRKELNEEQARLSQRLERPDYFERFEESDLPKDLEWVTNLDDPEIGSPEAKKGGTLHTYFAGFAYPRSIRSVGKESNNAFRSFHWDDNEMSLVKHHPNTRNIIPGLADRWAVAEDGQSVYFHIDDEAKWSDGREVTSEDFMMTFYVYLSPYLTPPFYRNYYGEQYWGISKYGSDYLCIRLAFPKPLAAYFATVMPFQEEFYREFGPDFEARYNWRTRPTTGAYVIHDKDVVKGRSITMTRDPDWWAKDRKYYKNRFNPDRIEFRLVRDPEKVFQMFLQGDIDYHLLSDPKKWYEKTEIEDVFNGYIERSTFYNIYPRTSWGLYFNLLRPPLDNLDVRIGLQHATNWEKVIELDLRGDADRLSLFNDGFDGISDASLETRPFSVKKARAAFARAGYDTADEDGILKNSEGERLSFDLSYAKIPRVEAFILRLKEEAKRAGVEFRLNGMDGSASFQRVLKKEHVIAFMGWGVGEPMIPDFYQQFHSKEAFEADGKTPRIMTNNISGFADPEIDPILERNRNATSMEEVIETSRTLERIFHERAVWVPAFKTTSYRLGSWRWVRWPDDFNVKMADLPDMGHVVWVDEEVKEETEKAMREGRKFDEVNRVYEQYREKPESEEVEQEVLPEVSEESAVEPDEVPAKEAGEEGEE